MIRFQIYLLLIISLTTSLGWGIEIYRFYDQNCSQATGIIVDVDELTVKIVNLDGEMILINKSEIKSVLVYKIITNPIKEIRLTADNSYYLKEVSFIQEGEKPLSGLLIQKIENLVFIFDQNGKYHVIELGQLGKIKSTEPIEKRIQFPFYKETKFTSGDYAFCPQDQNTDGISPARMIVDRIKIEDFISSLEDGFHQLKTFEERTHFYQRPYLFQKKSRFGLVSQVAVEQPINNFPFYFQWSTGEPYKVQTQTTLGGDKNFLSPSYENFFLVGSEVKNHFFHASFLGNLTSLSAGNEYYTFITLVPGNESRSFFASSLNYMALIGFDWNAFSFSFGNYYPLYLIRYQNSFHREILSSSVTPVFRFRYIKKDFKVSFLFSQNKQNITKPNDKHFSENPNISSENLLENFQFESVLFKTEAEFDINSKFTFGGGLSWLSGDYKELTLMDEVNKNDSLNRIYYVFIQYNLSRYFSIKGNLTNYDLSRKYSLNGIEVEDSNKKMNLGGVLEFIF